MATAPLMLMLLVHSIGLWWLCLQAFRHWRRLYWLSCIDVGAVILHWRRRRRLVELSWWQWPRIRGPWSCLVLWRRWLFWHGFFTAMAAELDWTGDREWPDQWSVVMQHHTVRSRHVSCYVFLLSGVFRSLSMSRATGVDDYRISPRGIWCWPGTGVWQQGCCRFATGDRRGLVGRQAWRLWVGCELAVGVGLEGGVRKCVYWPVCVTRQIVKRVGSDGSQERAHAELYKQISVEINTVLDFINYKYYT